jgi:hypothetical protein
VWRGDESSRDEGVRVEEESDTDSTRVPVSLAAYVACDSDPLVALGVFAFAQFLHSLWDYISIARLQFRSVLPGLDWTEAWTRAERYFAA